MTQYRKNENWKAIYVNVEAQKLNDLGDLVSEKMNTILTDEEKLKDYTFDIVDTIVVASNSNPITQTLVLELLIYVALV